MTNAFWLSVLTACIWGIVPLIEKQGLLGSDPVTGLFARSVGVLVGFLLFGLWWSPWKALWALSGRSFILLALGGFLASFIGQMVFYHALKCGHVSQVTPVSGTYPLVAAILAWIVLREPITITRVFGAVLVVVGALLLRR